MPTVGDGASKRVREEVAVEQAAEGAAQGSWQLPAEPAKKLSEAVEKVRTEWPQLTAAQAAPQAKGRKAKKGKAATAQQAEGLEGGLLRGQALLGLARKTWRFLGADEEGAQVRAEPCTHGMHGWLCVHMRTRVHVRVRVRACARAHVHASSL